MELIAIIVVCILVLDVMRPGPIVNKELERRKKKGDYIERTEFEARQGQRETREEDIHP
jgi:hypothetical protein